MQFEQTSKREEKVKVRISQAGHLEGDTHFKDQRSSAWLSWGNKLGVRLRKGVCARVQVRRRTWCQNPQLHTSCFMPYTDKNNKSNMLEDRKPNWEKKKKPVR